MSLTPYNNIGWVTPQRVRTLARTGGTAIGLASPGLARANALVQGGYKAYKGVQTYGPHAKRIAEWAYRRWKTRQTVKMSRAQRGAHVGEDPGQGTAKRKDRDSDGFLPYTTSELYEIDLVPIQRQDNTSASALDRRERDMVHLVGVKICMNFQNSSAFTQYHNVAVIAGKHRSSIGTTDFFRDNGNTERSTDFDNVSLTALRRHCLPINTDDYTVLYHKRWSSRPELSWANAGREPGKFQAGVQNFEFYIPINRQIRYENDGTASETPIYLVHWHGQQGLNAVNSQAKTAAGQVEFYIVTYFKEPVVTYTLAYPGRGMKRIRA